MAYAILLAPSAAREIRSLRASVRAEVLDAIDRHLSHEPTHVSRSRIKKLRGLKRPQYRMRVGDVRVFYDVRGRQVEVLAVVTKAQAFQWLRSSGVPDEESGSRQDQG